MRGNQALERFFLVFSDPSCRLLGGLELETTGGFNFTYRSGPFLPEHKGKWVDLELDYSKLGFSLMRTPIHIERNLNAEGDHYRFAPTTGPRVPCCGSLMRWQACAIELLMSFVVHWYYIRTFGMTVTFHSTPAPCAIVVLHKDAALTYAFLCLCLRGRHVPGDNLETGVDLPFPVNSVTSSSEARRSRLLDWTDGARTATRV